LVLIGLLSLDLKPKEKNALVDLLEKSNYQGIDQNLGKLSKSGTLYRLNYRKETKNNETLNRFVTKVEDIMK
jgi:hypothetical protein